MLSSRHRVIARICAGLARRCREHLLRPKLGINEIVPKQNDEGDDLKKDLFSSKKPTLQTLLERGLVVGRELKTA